MTNINQRAGMLRHRLTLEQRQQTDDGNGGVSISYSTVSEIYASIKSLTWREQAIADRLGSHLTHRITAYIHASILAGNRFRKANRIFRIMTIRDPEETGVFIECFCEEEK